MQKLFQFVFLACSLLSYAQKQGNIWYYGKQSGLNFNSGTTSTITGGQTGTDLNPGGNQEGTSSISDSSGALLFYTGGKTIWNRLHQAMPNGTNIMGGPSSTQAALIVPKPGSEHLFYVFTSDEFQSNYTKGYRYSVVDMCLDGGKGDVVIGQKNILLMDTATEKLAACLDAAGTGYWIVGHKMFSNKFIAWHLTSAGITGTVTSSLGTLHGWRYTNSIWVTGSSQGQMKINPQGTKLALAISNFDPGYLDLFDFNSSNGIVSNSCHMVIDSSLGKRIYGVEFSPDGTKLYATGSGGSGGVKVYQFNLAAAGTCSAIKATQSVVFQSFQNSVMFGMQLGPDNKIYLVSLSYHILGRINQPNSSATTCTVDPQAITSSGVINNYALPSFIAGYKYLNELVSFAAPQLTTTSSSSVICPGKTVTLTVSGAPSYSWSTGSTGSLIIVSPNSTSTYTITGSNIQNNSCIANTTITILVNPTPTLDATGATVCTTQTLNFSASSISGGFFVWAGPNGFSSGQQNPFIVNPAINATGYYTVTGTSAAGCTNIAVAVANVIPPPSLSIALSNNGTLCAQAINSSPNSITLTAGGAASYTLTTANYLDNLNPNGPVSPLISIPPFQNNASVSTATLEGSSGICTSIKTVTFTIIPNPTIALIPTPVICTGQNFVYHALGANSFTWGPNISGLNTFTGPVTVANPTVTSVYSVIGESLGCFSSSQTSTLIVNPLPTLTITSIHPIICLGQSIDLVASGTGTSYQWSPSIGLNSTSDVTVTAGPPYTQNYTVVTSANNCTNNAVVTVTVIPLPDGNLMSSKMEGCIPFSCDFKFNPANSPDISCSWTVGSLTYIDNSFTHFFTEPGKYLIVGHLKDTITKCTYTNTLTVIGYTPPVADFTWLPEKPVEEFDEVIFTNTSTGENQNQWNWYFNSGYTSNNENVSYLFKEAGDYPVAMVVKTEQGCSDTVVKNITIDQDFVMYVPNAFTPNGDDKNEIFLPVIRSAKKYSLQVYNRWGQLLFSTTDLSQGWDGTYSGEPCKQDVYNWKITLSSNRGVSKEQAGSVILYR